MDPGQVIEFIENGRYVVAMCTQIKQDQIAALTQTGREIKISKSRLIHISNEQFAPDISRNDLEKLLKDRGDVRDELKGDVTIEELWELVQGEEESYEVKFLAEILFGNDCSPEHEAALLRAVLEEGLHFKYRQGMIFPREPEVVERLIAQREQELERERELQEGARWFQSLWEGAEKEIDAHKRDHYIEALKQIALGDNNLPLHSQGKELLVRAGLEGEDKAFDALVRLGIWKADENLELIRHDIPVKHPSGAIEEAHRAISENRFDRERPQRQNLSQTYIVTIDGAATRDFDDAISLTKSNDGYRLGVHIADVATYIDPDTLLDKHALELAASIYLPDERISMFPQEIADNLCSLRQDEERLALSLFIDLDDEVNVVSYEFSPSVIKVSRRLTYQEVDLLEGREPLIDSLRDITFALQKKRFENGALPQPPFEVAVSLDPQGEVSVRKIERDSISRTIVSESMILANTLAARFLKESNTPCLFRSQEQPQEKVKGDFDSDPYLLFQQRRYLKRMIISSAAGVHSSLGVDQYTHITSPIRRYLDLVMQRQIISMLLDGKPRYTSEELERLSLELGPALKRINAVRQRRNRYWLIRYFERLIGSTTQAVVLRKFSKYYRIQLMDYLMECNLPQPTNISLSPGDYVLVKFEKANARQDTLKIKLI